MASHILKNPNFELAVHTRTKSKAEGLIAQGAKWLELEDMTEHSDVLLVMLGHPHEVEEVLLANYKGLIHHMKEGSVLIDHTTNSPDLAKTIAKEAEKRGVLTLDAPVSGSDIGA